MEPSKSDFYVLLPGRRTRAKGIACDAYDKFYGIIRRWRLLWNEPGYCKLALLRALARRCNKAEWVKENRSDLLYVYFLMIYDRGVLFAQTREHTGTANTPTCRSFYTNCPQKRLDRKTAADQVIQELLDDTCTDLYCRSAGLTTSDLLRVLRVVTAEWVQPREGRPPMLFSISDKQRDRLMYRSREEPEGAWAQRQEQQQYEITKVLGSPAPVYYQEHRQSLAVTEEQWRQVMLHYIERLSKQVTWLIDSQKHYRPFFTHGQPQMFLKICQQADADADYLGTLMKVWDRSNLLEECPLPASITHQEKLERFAGSLGAIGLEINPVDAGILWLMRTGLGPLFCRRQSGKPPEDHPRINVSGACRYFERIRTSMEGCLVYSERELLSWNPAVIRRNVETVIRNQAYQQLRQKVCARFQTDLTEHQIRSNLTRYRKYFISPQYPQPVSAGDAPGEFSTFLQSIVDQLHWHDLPTAQVYRELRLGSGTVQETLKKNLVEYACMEGLIRQGYEDLHTITRTLFHKVIVYRD